MRSLMPQKWRLDLLASRRHAAAPDGNAEGVPRALRVSLLLFAASAPTLPPLILSVFPAGDLHSHLYNAWLGRMVNGGQLKGLTLASDWTNVLTDRVLAALLGRFSPRVVEAVVLVILGNAFVWSAFAFCRALSRRDCWEWLPIIVMLSLGWTYHMGFSNWYASAALSLSAGALALSSRPGVLHWLLAAGFVLAATWASPLPPAWIVTIVAVVAAVEWVPRRSGYVLAAVVLLVGFVGAAISLVGRGWRGGMQWINVVGADQVYVFDSKYRLLSIGVLAPLAWGAVAAFRGTVHQLTRERSFVAAVVASASIVAIPDVIAFPGYAVPVAFIAQRSSVFAGLAWTALASRSPASRFRLALVAGLGIAWAATLGGDWWRLSVMQERIVATVAELPAGSRVVSTFVTPPSRVAPLAHAVDRACAGRCFAWGNYEPATGVFPTRIGGENPYVVAHREDVAAILMGTYVVPALPFPLRKLHECPSPASAGAVCVSDAPPGQRLGLSCIDPFRWSKALERCSAE